MQHQKGFTLLEIIIALCVLSIFSVMALKGIQTILGNRDHIEARLDGLNQLQMASVIMQRDIAQMVDRPANNTGSSSDSSPLNATSSSLSFTRMGYSNPMGLERRSTLQYVEYNFSNGLTRTATALLDPAGDPDSQMRTLLTGPKSMSFKYVDKEGQLHDTWPPSEPPPNLGDTDVGSSTSQAADTSSDSFSDEDANSDEDTSSDTSSNANSNSTTSANTSTDDTSDTDTTDTNSANSDQSTDQNDAAQTLKWPLFPSGIQVTLEYDKDNQVVWLFPVNAGRLRPKQDQTGSNNGTATPPSS